jgi:hypothetical protein
MIGQKCPHCGATWSYERSEEGSGRKSGCSPWAFVLVLIIIVPIVIAFLIRAKRSDVLDRNDEAVREIITASKDFPRTISGSYIVVSEDNLIYEVTEVTIPNESQNWNVLSSYENPLLIEMPGLDLVIPIESVVEIERLRSNHVHERVFCITYKVNNEVRKVMGNLTTKASKIQGKTVIGDLMGDYTIDMYNLKYLSREKDFVSNHNPMCSAALQRAIIYTKDNDTIEMNSMVFTSQTKGEIQEFQLSNDYSMVEIPFSEIREITYERKETDDSYNFRSIITVIRKDGKRASMERELYDHHYDGFVGVSQLGCCKVEQNQILRLVFLE